jgi:hypothetical protein
VGGPELARLRQPLVHGVHDHHRSRPDQLQRQHRTEADAAGADHDDPFARSRVHHVQDGAGAGHDGAPGDRCDLRWDVVIDLHERALGNYAAFGEAGDAHEVVHLLAACLQTGCAIEQAAGRRGYPSQGTERRPAGAAVPAVPAARPPQGDHPVAGSEAVDPRPDGLDDPRALVAEDDRQLRLQVTGHVMQVAVAHARGEHADQDLARTRVSQVYVLDPERGARLPQHCGPHRSSDI